MPINAAVKRSIRDGHEVTLSCGRTYLGKNPKYAQIPDANGVVSWKKTAKGVPFVRVKRD